MNEQRNSLASWAWLAIGYAFLYVPISLLGSIMIFKRAQNKSGEES